MDIKSNQQHGARGAIVRIAAVVVAVAMLVATAMFGVGRAQAAELAASADPTTFTQWTEGVGNPLDPRSNGRVWTDKSVTTGDVSVPAGTVRMGLANYTVAKKDNVTKTATAAIAPRWDGATVDVALGNNGRLAVAQQPATPDPKPEHQPTAPAETTNTSTANTGSSVALIICVAAALLCSGLGTLQLKRHRPNGRHAG